MEPPTEEPESIETLVAMTKSALVRQRFDDAIILSNRIWELDKEEALAWYFKGKAYLELNNYTNSINCFDMALDLAITDVETARDCKHLLTTAKTKKTLSSVTRNWFQSESHVFIHVMAKNMKRQHVHVLFEEKNVVCSMKIPPFNVFYDLFLNLARNIVPENSVINVMKNKVEIKLEKDEKGVYWEVLDLDTKAKYAKNGREVSDFWKIPEDEPLKLRTWKVEEEDPPPPDNIDDLLHRLFASLHAQLDDDKRRAFEKSFIESKGTVASTSWKRAEEGFGVRVPKHASHHISWG